MFWYFEEIWSKRGGNQLLLFQNRKIQTEVQRKISIDFEEYRGILDYISELDEFKNSVDKLNKSMIRFIDISKIDDSVEQRIKEQGADSQQ